MFDVDSPILPGFALAGIQIGSHLTEIYDDLKKVVYDHSGNFWLEDPFYIRYEKRGFFSVVVHALNGKVIKLGALENYTGAMPSGVKLGMPLSVVKELEPNLVYDDFEENYCIEGMPGISIEVSDDEPRQRVVAITVFVADLRNNWDQNKELGKW